MDLGLRLSQVTGVPRYRQIVDHIADLVRGGALEPGSPLPSVRELAADLLVSLITVRRAYAELERAGIVQQLQGRGTFVAPRVPVAARRRARSDALDAVERAVQRALRAGVAPDEVREVVEEAAEEVAERMKAHAR